LSPYCCHEPQVSGGAVDSNMGVKSWGVSLTTTGHRDSHRTSHHHVVSSTESRCCHSVLYLFNHYGHEQRMPENRVLGRMFGLVTQELTNKQVTRSKCITMTFITFKKR